MRRCWLAPFWRCPIRGSPSALPNGASHKPPPSAMSPRTQLTAMAQDLAPGATIGILGGGQLGRMLAMAAAELGLRTHIFSPDPQSPAFEVAGARTLAPYEDEAALVRFAGAVDVVTYEFENVPARTAAVLAAIRPVRPNPGALETSQDRLVEKQFLNGLGIATAPYAQVDDAGALARAVAQLGRPSILKTRRFGYDGKGQTILREGSDLAVTFRSLGGVPAILEGVVPFIKEVSVVAARGLDGAFAAFDVCENQHHQSYFEPDAGSSRPLSGGGRGRRRHRAAYRRGARL